MKCEKCGKELPEGVQTCPDCNKKNGHLPMILVAVGGFVLAVIVGVVVGVLVRNADAKTMSDGAVTLGELRQEIQSASAELQEAKAGVADAEKQLSALELRIQEQEKKVKPLEDYYDYSLAPGTYRVGVDLNPGIYHFTYLWKTDEESWGDYIYVKYAGSEGTEETYGGISFDYRIGAENNGEQVSLKLDSGSTVYVEGDYGLWMPGQRLTISGQ